MTRNSKLALVAAAVVGAIALGSSSKTPTPEDTVVVEPFWQLHGAGPSSSGVLGAIAMQTAHRAAATPDVVVAAR